MANEDIISAPLSEAFPYKEIQAPVEPAHVDKTLEAFVISEDGRAIPLSEAIPYQEIASLPTYRQS